MSKRIGRRNLRIIVRSLGIVGVVVVLKAAAHLLDLEVLSLNPLLAGIVGADVFLMGFLLSGVLSDFKESEKLPGEVAASIEIMFDEAKRIERREATSAVASTGSSVTGIGSAVRELARTLHQWFYKEQRTTALMQSLDEIGSRLDALEASGSAASASRIRQEQCALRRTIIRIHTIRETSFISSGYLIARLTTGLLSLALILSSMEPFYESIFIVGVIVFLLAFLLFLIGDLDNPFGYYDKASAQDVSLKPIEDMLVRLGADDAGQRA